MMPSVPRQAPIFLILALLISITPSRAETGPLPDGWRLPTTAEMDAPWRTDDPHRYLRADGDFDGDGVSDTAFVLIADTLGPRGHPSAIGVFAWLSRPGGGRSLQTVHLLKHPLPVDFAQFGVAARPAGRYVTACGAGYGDRCRPGEPAAIDLENAGIECCLFESVTGIFWWNRAAGRFDGVPISD